MDSLTDKKFLISKLQRFSLQDGPGIRTTVFLKGCALKCAWCHNPECINPQNEIFQNIEKCVKCGECARVCPENAITPPQEVREKKKSSALTVDEENDYEVTVKPPKIDRNKCTLCMQCVEACNYDALTKAATLITVGEVLDEIKSDEVFYKTSGGGATISGGDPLFHAEITLILLKLLKEHGISTAIDTSGYAKWEIIESLLQYVDIVLFDIKTLNDEKHIKWTGVSNTLILENARKMAKTGVPIRLRLPIIHDVTYWDLEHPRSVVAFARELGQNISGIDILPYHSLGEPKYEWLGRTNFFKGFPNLYEEDVEEYVKIIREGGPWDVTVGGMLGVKKEGVVT